MDRHTSLGAGCMTAFKQAISRLGLSTRSFYRMLEVAWAIADLKANEKMLSAYIAEAIQYRRFNRAQQ